MTTRLIALSAGLALAGLLTACGSSPTGPSSTPPPPPVTTPSSIDGTYTVRFDNTCAALPAELKSRTYTASIGGSQQIVVTLTGADFWAHPTEGLLNRFTGSVFGNSVNFNLRTASRGWGIVERIDETSYFEIIGTGLGSGDGLGLIRGSTIEGTLNAGVGFGSDLRDDARHIGCGPGHDVAFRFTR